ncbi:hypothetical protein [Nesterenkonia sp. NBAIMH1]|uniref:hypothetical protein n=1 Tax=Nesterenkonia sp. NBAIMH1 TaxID=2600320 RepID=UPI0011B5B6C8|nr:hypothetical protein [Nesterenkonia sp. NBAIMH1]
MTHFSTSALGTASAAVVLALALSSCGQNGQEDTGAEEPEAAVEQYWASLEQGDAEAACELTHSEDRGGTYAQWNDADQQACVDEHDDLAEWVQQEPASDDVETIAQVFTQGDTEIHEQDNGEASIHHTPATDDYPAGPALYDVISVSDHWYLNDPDPLPISADF